MEKGNGNGNTVLLTVIGVATLLVALVGATFAYFTATVNNNTAQSLSVTTATPVGLVYTGSNLVLDNAIPGNNDTKTFTVNNPGTSTTAQTYDLDLIVDANEFVATDGAEQLIVTITSDDADKLVAGFETGMDFTDGTTDAVKTGAKINVVKTQRIEIGATQTYTIKVEFKELNKAQDTNQGKNFNAHIEISNPVSVQ